MAKAKVVGINLFTEDITRMANLTEEMVGRSIYEGAKILADAVKAELEALPVDADKDFGTPEKPLSGIKAIQKSYLSHSFGIAKMRNSDGTYDIKMGFDGYNSVKTEKHPNGQPNALIARAIESGTSFRKKNPFITRAYNKAKAASEESMKEVFDKYFK